MLRIMGMFLVALILAGCNRTSYYVPPDKFEDPVSAQCRGHSSETEFKACTIAARSGRSYADVWREMKGREISGEPSSPYSALLSPLTYAPPCIPVDDPYSVDLRCRQP